MKKQEIEQHCTELVTPIIEEHGFELVDVEYVKEGSDYYLRVYADKEGGINIDDCDRPVYFGSKLTGTYKTAQEGQGF